MFQLLGVAKDWQIVILTRHTVDELRRTYDLCKQNLEGDKSRDVWVMDISSKEPKRVL